MTLFEHFFQDVKGSYNPESRRLIITKGERVIVSTIVPENQDADYWHGEDVDGLDVDFNLSEAEDGKRFLAAYRVVGTQMTDRFVNIPLTVK